MEPIFILLAAAYIAPTLIAWGRLHHNTPAIGALNILLGWTVLGWIAAFIWALTAVPREALHNEKDPKP